MHHYIRALKGRATYLFKHVPPFLGSDSRVNLAVAMDAYIKKTFPVWSHFNDTDEQEMLVTKMPYVYLKLL